MKRSPQGHLCGVSASLDVLGDRWALLVVRELLFSPKRFGDLLRGLPGIGTNTLTARLAELEDAGVLEKRTTPPPLSLTAYALTDRGRALQPVLVHLARWGAHRLVRTDPEHRMQPAWLGLAMLAFFDSGVAPRKAFRAALVFPDGTLTVDIGPGGVAIREERANDVDVTLTLDREETFLALMRRATTVATAVRKKRLRIDGDGKLVSPLLIALPPW